MPYLVDPRRLTTPQDRFCDSFPGLGFRDRYSFSTSGEPVLIADPVYLADVYNSTDETASILRERGFFVMDFGGDVSSPVWWQEPFVLLPISMHLSIEDLSPRPGTSVLAEEIGTDSGSYIFLPFRTDLPQVVINKVQQVVAEGNGVLLDLPAGHWELAYEQWDAPEPAQQGLYRNIVLRWSPSVDG